MPVCGSGISEQARKREGLAPLQLLSQSQVSPLLRRDLSALERLQGGDKSHKSYERSENVRKAEKSKRDQNQASMKEWFPLRLDQQNIPSFRQYR